MKFTVKLITSITVLVLLVVTVQAQTVGLYGCLQGQRTSANLTGRNIVVTTGARDLDNSLIEDITALNNNFGVSVPMYFFEDQSDDAFFTPTKFPHLMELDGVDQYANVTGSVFLGKFVILKEFQANGSTMSLPAIVGHEFAHAMQHANRYPYRGKFLELHADLMAGWFVAFRGEYRLQDPKQAAMALYKRGDYDFFSEEHHGTPQERGSAFAIGYALYKDRRLSAVQTYNAGLEVMKTAGAN